MKLDAWAAACSGINPWWRSYRTGLSAGWMALALILTVGVAVAQTTTQPELDVYLKKRIDNARPALGGIVTYTLVVGNAGSQAASGVIVGATLPAGGVQYESHTVRRGTSTFSPQTGQWTVGAIAASDSAILEIRARVLNRGVWYSTAQVTAMQGTDFDSLPNNDNVQEDDYGTACFTVPLYWYTGYEYRVAVPAGLTGTQWFRNGRAINASFPADTAVVRNDTLLIKAPGTYTFTTTLGNCPQGGCCPIEVIQGPCASLGDYVWLDKNYNGRQDADESGVADAQVELYDEAGTRLATTRTNASGQYRFDCLPSGTYRLRFFAQTGTIMSTFRALGVANGANSDAQLNGFTPFITLDAEKATTDTLRNNPGFDCGLAPFGSIGDLVWDDTNGNGRQDQGEPGVSGVRVQLYDQNDLVNSLKTLTTNTSGRYKFDSLLTGNYVLRFQLPTGFRFVAQKVGTDTEIDSDVNASGQTAVVALDAQQPLTSQLRNNVTIDAGIRLICADPLAVTAATSASLVCSTSPVSLTAGVTGGQAPFSYAWTGPNSFSFTITNPVLNLSTPATGTYTVRITDANGCSGTAAVGLTVNPALAVTALGSPTCVGSPLSLSATVTGGSQPYTYAWSGPNSFTAAVAQPSLPNATTANAGSYTVVITDASGCSATASTTVAVGSVQPVASNSGPACVGGTLSLSATAGTSYAWTGPNGFTSTVQNPVINNATLAMAGSYTVVVGSGGCSGVATTTVTVNNPLAVTAASSASLLCGTSPASLTATVTGGQAPYTYAWTGPGSFSATGSSNVLSLNTPATGSYQVRVTDANGCSGTAAVGLTVNPALAVTALGSPTCVGSPLSLSATVTGGSQPYTYAWSGPNSFTAAVAQPSLPNATTANAGSYTVVITDASGCSATASTTVAVGSQPVAANSGPVCDGGTINLSATAGTSYAWTGPNGFTSNLQNPVIANATLAAAGSYTVIVGGLSGCSGVATTTVTINPKPLVTASVNSSTLCAGEAILLSAGVTSGTPPYRYAWTGPNNFATTSETATVTLPNALTTATGSYTVVITDASGCTATGVTSVTVANCCNVEPPVITCALTTICPGGETTLKSANCAGTVVWSNGQTGSSLVVSPLVTTTYTAQCRLDNCISNPSNAITITVNDPKVPVVTAEADTVCIGGTVRLLATGCTGTIIWSTGATGSSLTVTVNSPTTYYANCRIANCISGPSNKVTIQVGSPSAPRIIGSVTQLCAGEQAVLSVAGCFGTPIWSTGDSTTSITVRPTQTTAYSVYCRRGTCVSPRSTNYTIATTKPEAPVVQVSADTVCAGSRIILTATGCVGGTIIWSSGPTGVSSFTTTVTNNINYSAFCKVGNCTSDASNIIGVVVVSPSVPIIRTTSSLVCAGEPVTLTAQGCTGTVVWSNNRIGASITELPGSTTQYTARCQVGDCLGSPSNAVTVTVNNSAAPKPTVAVSKTEICKGEIVTLTASGCTGGTIVWSTGATGVSSLTVAPEATTEYYAACQIGTQCLGQPTKQTVTVRAVRTPEIVCSATRICPGDSVKLTIVHCTGTPLWSTGETTTSIYVSPKVTTAYTAICQLQPCNSDRSKEYVITVDKPEAPTLTASKLTIEPGESVVISASGCTGGTIVWSTGVSGVSSLTVTPTSTTSYFAQCRLNACLSDVSAQLTIRTRFACDSTIAAPVVVAQARNACPSPTVDLRQVIESRPRTTGGIFEFRTGNQADSPPVLNPIAVGEGRYYIFERTLAGCYSLPAEVNVRILTCTDTCRVDLFVTKTASKTVVAVGDTVRFTLVVGNKGPCLATNAIVRDQLPQGLVPVATTGLQTDAQGRLGAIIDTIRAGREVIFTYTARVTAAGPLTNTVRVQYRDQPDPDSTNDQASVTLRNAAASGYIGLAKQVGRPTKLADGLYRIPYTFTVTNYGTTNVSRVQVADSLDRVFAPHTIEGITFRGDSTNTLRFNTAFTGIGANTRLLDSTSTLAAGATARFGLDVTVRLQSLADTGSVFNNRAFVTARMGSETIRDQSTAGTNPDANNDGNPTNDSNPTPVRLGAEPAMIGVALAVVKVEEKPNSSYHVTYQIIVRNFANTPLTNVQLADTLSRAFASPVVFSVLGTPLVRKGSSLVPNLNFNGSSNANILSPSSTLPVGAVDTVWVTVNIQTNGQFGPFYTQVLARGQQGNVVATDLSNNGFDPNPLGNQPTAVRFDLPSSLLGVAKSVGIPQNRGNGIFDVPYVITLTNYGSTDLTNVQVEDNLATTFGSGAVLTPGKIPLTVDAGLVADTNYTGVGLQTKLLVESRSTLPRGASRSIRFTVRVDVKNADSTRYYNMAVARANGPNNVSVSDESETGVNADPDNDLDPRNNSRRTMVTLGIPPAPRIGVALSVRDTARQEDGSYNVRYMVVVRNYGNLPLENIRLVDTLAKAFNEANGASYRVVVEPVVPLGSRLVPNRNFNGDTDVDLLSEDSRLLTGAAGADTLYFTINVRTDGRKTPYLTQVFATATGGTITVRDASTNGTNPDPNGNRNPSDPGEAVPTPLILQSTKPLFIPEGFSPNGDGINDRFVIQNPTDATISLEVYNRWGHLVYKNDNYQNDWDGTPNTGLQINSAANGLPDGTYYYIVRLSDGRKFVRYMTINR